MGWSWDLWNGTGCATGLSYSAGASGTGQVTRVARDSRTDGITRPAGSRGLSCHQHHPDHHGHHAVPAAKATAPASSLAAPVTPSLCTSDSILNRSPLPLWWERPELSLQIPALWSDLKLSTAEAVAHTHLGPASRWVPTNNGCPAEVSLLTHHVAPMRMGTHSRVLGPLSQPCLRHGNLVNSSAMRLWVALHPLVWGQFLSAHAQTDPAPLLRARVSSPSLQTPSEPLFLCTFKTALLLPTWRALTGDHPAECGSLSLTSGRSRAPWVKASLSSGVPHVGHVCVGASVCVNTWAGACTWVCEWLCL